MSYTYSRYSYYKCRISINYYKYFVCWSVDKATKYRKIKIDYYWNFCILRLFVFFLLFLCSTYFFHIFFSYKASLLMEIVILYALPLYEVIFCEYISLDDEYICMGLKWDITINFTHPKILKFGSKDFFFIVITIYRVIHGFCFFFEMLITPSISELSL